MGRSGTSSTARRWAALAYARIQGKAALVVHFQNSSLMNEDKRRRPILFHSDEPEIGGHVFHNQFIVSFNMCH